MIHDFSTHPLHRQMPTITANSTAAYFNYTGQWSRTNTHDPGSRIWQAGDSINLRIQASSLDLFGNFLSVNSNNTSASKYNMIIVKGPSLNSSCAGNVTNNSLEEKLCTIPSLDASRPTDLTLSLGDGSAGLKLGRIVWIDPNASDHFKQSIKGSSASANSTGWTVDTQGGTSCTSANASSLTLGFEGTGVVVRGKAMSQNMNATYRILVDDTLMLTPRGSDRWEAYGSPMQEIELYRNDRLENSKHNISISDIQSGGQFCVLRADVFGPPASASVAAATSWSRRRKKKRLSKGQTKICGIC
ncbi:hypothetical protein OPQ81_011142 [Rhizoctonia solani]|nr:hypothetical protein OPQ81_011142 [Rhizoctonia solani]